VAAWQSSGLSISAFSHREGLTASMLGLRIPDALERPFRRHLNADSGRT
jgi:hypothetical protein